MLRTLVVLSILPAILAGRVMLHDFSSHAKGSNSMDEELEDFLQSYGVTLILPPFYTAGAGIAIYKARAADRELAVKVGNDLEFEEVRIHGVLAALASPEDHILPCVFAPPAPASAVPQTHGVPPKPMLVMPLGSYGSLKDEVFSSRKLVSEDQVRKLGFQMLKAVQFLHDRHVAHADIHPRNFLVTKHLEGDIIIDLMDFGFSLDVARLRTLKSNPDHLLDYYGPLRGANTEYRPPSIDEYRESFEGSNATFLELVNKYIRTPLAEAPHQQARSAPADSPTFSWLDRETLLREAASAPPASALELAILRGAARNDVYSVGMILFEMLGFWEMRLEKGLTFAEAEGELPSEACKEALRALLNDDPNERCTAADALALPWFQGLVQGPGD